MKKRFDLYFIRMIFIFVFFAIFSVGIAWFIQMYIHYQKTLLWVETEYKDDKQKSVKNLVESIVNLSKIVKTEEKNQEKYLNKLNQIASASIIENGQINLYSLDGKCLATSGWCGFVGKNLLHLESADKKRYIQLGFEKAKNGGGFVEFKLLKKGVMYSKIGYFKMIPNTNYIISGCQSYNDLDASIVTQKELMQTNFIHGIVILIFICLVLGGAIFYIFKKLLGRFRDEIEDVNSFLATAQTTNIYLDCNKFTYDEITKIAELINKLIISRVEYENNLLEEKQNADKANESKVKFIAQMSHEIRTPMNSILGFSELLRLSNLDIKQHQYLHSIIVSAEVLLNTLNDILDARTLEMKKVELHSENFALMAMINEVSQMYQQIARNKGVNFSVEFELSQNVYLKTDKSKLRQIITNLVSNAIKFTNQGYVWLIIKAHGTSGLSLVVEDSGIGIADESFGLIFEPFSQEKNINETYGGTGLGLYIVKNIVELLKGSLKFSSQKGVGTRFEIVFENIISDLMIEVPSNQNTLETKFKDNPLVLVVDDKIKNIELLCEMLQGFEMNTIWATDGKKALSLVQTNQVNLILTDLVMPVMDGIKFATELKKRNLQIPIIAVSADTSFSKMDKNRLFDDFVLKPISLQAIKAILEKFISKTTLLECLDVQMQPDDKIKLPALLELLEQKIVPMLVTLEMVIDFEECERFMEILQDINRAFKNPILNLYIEAFSKDLELFDVVKLEQKISNFSVVIETMKKEIR